MKNKKLHEVRTRLQKSQSQIAEAVGIQVVTYQRYEYGVREPGVRTAIRIADELNVIDLRELFAEESTE